MKEYALYKGDQILAIGTISQIAEQMGVKRETIAYYKTQAYQNRLERRNAFNGNIRQLISLEDDEEQRCRVCGCTWNNACVGGCYWVEEDLCNQCAERDGED